MAQRRMFNKSITNSSLFLKMPATSRLLYYDLGMNADDDGFVEHFMVLRMTGATQQDLGVLELNGLVKIFDENVLWIKDWKENNYIPKDRYQQSKYLQLYNIEDYIEVVEKVKKPLSESQLKRLEAKKESNLPSTFESQIRSAFNGQKCPICGKTMNFERDIDNPSIQHNVPISLGGKHEIDNISVICRSCNCSIQNREITPAYNTEEVKKVWKCIGNVYTGKDSIGKDSIDNNIYSLEEPKENKTIKLIIDYLNSKAMTNYRATSQTTKKHINARLKEGYKFDDFVTVIDNKTREWMKTDMEKYLRPETLFGTKFESYLNQKDSSRPVWFDKKQEKSKMTKEEEIKMNNIMEKYK